MSLDCLVDASPDALSAAGISCTEEYKPEPPVWLNKKIDSFLARKSNQRLIEEVAPENRAAVCRLLLNGPIWQGSFTEAFEILGVNAGGRFEKGDSACTLYPHNNSVFFIFTTPNRILGGCNYLRQANAAEFLWYKRRNSGASHISFDEFKAAKVLAHEQTIEVVRNIETIMNFGYCLIPNSSELTNISNGLKLEVLQLSDAEEEWQKLPVEYQVRYDVCPLSMKPCAYSTSESAYVLILDSLINSALQRLGFDRRKGKPLSKKLVGYIAEGNQ